MYLYGSVDGFVFFLIFPAAFSVINEIKESKGYLEIENSHPSHSMFTLSPSGKRYGFSRHRTTRLQSSFTSPGRETADAILNTSLSKIAVTEFKDSKHYLLFQTIIKCQ